jgi:toxin ParE1/3/4
MTILGDRGMDRGQQPGCPARVGRRILDAIERLDEFPLRGRPGRSPDTRELVISGLPYLAVYSVDSADPRTVVILRVLHGTMLWPPRQALRRV